VKPLASTTDGLASLHFPDTTTRSPEAKETSGSYYSIYGYQEKERGKAEAKEDKDEKHFPLYFYYNSCLDISLSRGRAERVKVKKKVCEWKSLCTL
jgi:hypothetical protein